MKLTSAAISSHGVGDHKKDYNCSWGVEELPVDNVDSFYYDDLSDKDLFTRLLKFAVVMGLRGSGLPVDGEQGKRIADYVADLVVFFFRKKSRDKILERKREHVENKLKQGYSTIYLVGHSLGSVVDYLFAKTYPMLAVHCVLISVGSPMGSPLKVWRLETGLGKIVRFILEDLILGEAILIRPNVKDWYNFYSRLDPLSGVIYNMGCELEDQYRVEEQPLHSNVDLYIDAVARVLKARH